MTLPSPDVMGTPLRILVLEDQATDAEMLIREVKRAGFNPDWRRVETEAEFLAALANAPDLILSDYSLPHFDGLRAVALVRERGLDTPFILVSGTLGEEAAVAAMKFGADDYLMKGRTVRLGLAIRRALDDKRLRDERKQAEERLRKLSHAVEQGPALVVITDRAGNIEYVNPKFTRVTGYSLAEVLGRNPRIWNSGETSQEVYENLWNTITAGGEWHGEFHNRTKNGELYWESAAISPIRDATGNITHFLSVKEDVTARRKLEEQYRQAQKMEGIGQLASGVAHDFNNILEVIQMQASLLKDGDHRSPEHDALADDIGHAVQRAAALTRQLLLFSRKEVLRAHDLDLNQSIESMLKMLRRTIGEDIKIEIKLAGPSMWLHADPGMLDQVLLNLAVNARDAMPRGGQLVIETSGVEFDEQAASQSANIRPGAFVCLSVSDTGGGIPPEILLRIFEPFFTTKEVGKGTGLGLATVFGIVQQHRGWINVYSEVGHGTTLRIYLPRLAERFGTKFAEATSTLTPGGNEVILLVEDDPAVREITQLSLNRLGYQVLDAPDGLAAVAVWKAHRDEIQLVLTDMVMPGGMNGIELGAHLLKENPNLKVIYASGYSADVAGTDFPLTDGVNFLTKPYERAKLAQALRAILDA